MTIGSYKERVVVAPLTESNDQQSLDVRVESYSTLNHRLNAPLLEVDVRRISVSVQYQADTALPKTPLNEVELLNGDRLDTAPSGLSISAIMSPESSTKDFLRVLQTLASQRLLVAPVVSPTKKRLRRFLSKKRLLSGARQFTIILPLEGSTLASEGLSAFLALPPCRAQAGLWSMAQAEEWSNLLLGHGSLVSNRPRGLWMDWRRTKTGAAWAQGVFYTTPMSKDSVTLADLMPNPAALKDQRSTCPLASSTTVQVVADPSSMAWQPACAGKYDTAVLSLDSNWTQPCWTMAAAPPPRPIPRWETSLQVTRRAGQANQGRLTAHAKNGDECGAYAFVSWTVSAVVEPIWQSLQASSSQGSIPWHSLQSQSIKMEENGDYTIHVEHRIDAGSSLDLSLDYQPAFLPFESFPADPNRGLELPPVSVRFLSECTRESTPLLYSNTALLMPPVPDMSMPFNVLSLTCTLYAFVIGSILKQSMAKASEKIKYTLHPDQKPKSLLTRMREKVKALLRRSSRSS